MEIAVDAKLAQMMKSVLEQDRAAGRLLEQVAFFPENLGKTTDSSNRAGCYIIRI